MYYVIILKAILILNLSCHAIINILFFRGIYIGPTDNMYKVVEKAQLWESEHSFISQIYF